MSMCRCPWVILTDRSFLFATGVLRLVTDVDRGLVDLCPFQSLPPRGAPSVAAAAAASVNAVAASGAAASSARDNDSKKALEHQGRLECFVLKHAADTEFGKFIQALDGIVGDGNFPTAAHRANRLKYVPVDTNTLSGYLKHLMHPAREVDPATGIEG